MGRRWIRGSANQAPLDSVLQSIRLRGGNGRGKIIIVRGEAGAGASAFASRLHSLLLRSNIKSAFIPRLPFNADFLFSTHLFKSLGLPSSSFDITAARRVTRHYEAAMHLRCYRAVICEDAHDFFHKHQIKKENIYDSIHRLTLPPYNHLVVLCGLRDSLTVVGDRAIADGMDVEYVDLRPMRCDQSYLGFVRDVVRTFAPIGNSESLSPFLLPIRAPLLLTDQVTAKQSGHVPLSPPAPISNPMVSEFSAGDTQLGAGAFLALNPCPLGPEGLDVSILHAHTKGLVGNTVSVVKGLLAAWLSPGSSNTPSKDVISRPAFSSVAPANTANSTLPELPDRVGPAISSGQAEDAGSLTESTNDAASSLANLRAH